MMRCWSWAYRVVIGSLTVGGLCAIDNCALAQLTPDGTLGNESSVVTPNVMIRGGVGDRIDGGALRGSNLFHSFQQFNVDLNQRVYFANPVGVNSILTRVTGADPSRIFGTLGVDGGANLFLINPQGILFGPNARLDIAGSFTASTANRLDFGNGLHYSATNPEAPPLLMVNLRPGLQYGANPGTIASTGNLAVGQDLTLAGGNLLLQGQLQAGRDLTLQATDTVQIRDNATTPFIASAGGNLLVQGDRAVDIVALSHPSSGLVSGGDLVLRSAGTIGGDTYYTSGGDFRIEQLDGSLGEWISPADPVIRSAGNVSFTNYTGASLHIFAGGSVTANAITVNGADGVNGINETVTLSNGTPLAINGRTRSTLDIRAGVNASAIGTPAGLTGAPSPTNLTFPPLTNANINVTTITNTQPNSLVYLSNQYQPNTALPGNITVGNISTNSAAGNSAVVLDSRGNITTNGRINASSTAGNGGAVTMLAGGDITINTPTTAPGTFGLAILTDGLLGGAMTFSSGGTISVVGINNRNRYPISSTSNTTVPGSRGGDITLIGRAISLSNAAAILNITNGSSNSGDIVLTATDSILVDNGEIDTIVLPNVTGRAGNVTANARSVTLQSAGATASFLQSLTQGNGNTGNVTVNADTLTLNAGVIATLVSRAGLARGNAGDVFISVRSLSAINGGQINSTTNAIGNAGNITINAADSVLLDGSRLSGAAGAVVRSNINSSADPRATGRGGNTNITTNSLTVSNGAQIRATTSGPQNGGNITIAANSIVFNGFEPRTGTPTGISSEVNPGGTGSAGDIIIRANSIAFSGGAAISAATNSTIPQGNAGHVLITADTVSFDGAAPILTGLNSNTPFGTGTSIRLGTNGAGRGGRLELTANSLAITNGAQFRSNTQGSGDAGSITLRIADSILIAGNGSGVFASSTAAATGNSGSIFIDPRTVTLRDGASISVSSLGSGRGGDIFLEAGRLILNNAGGTNAGIRAEATSGQGGNITLRLQDYLLLRNGSLISTTSGIEQRPGDAGNITINAPFIVAVATEDSNIIANAFTGRGGNINITAQGIFGIEPRPQLTAFSDITASSEFGLQGEVIINTPDIDPSRGLVSLPINLVDASKLVAQNCSAQGAIATKQGEFIITGRGGLPPGPADALNSQGGWQDLRPPTQLTAQRSQDSSSHKLHTQAIVEAQGWIIAADGQIALVAQSNTTTPHGSWAPSAACPEYGSLLH